MKPNWIWLGLGVVTGGLGVALATGHLDVNAVAGLDRKPGKTALTAAEQPPAVTVIRPAMRKFVETLRVNGTLMAREEILIAPQIEGQRIRELLVDIGDRVTRGQLLARLATENLDAQLDQNAAAINRAAAGIAQAASSIKQAEARMQEADSALRRATPLSKSGYMSQSILEQRQAAATSARAALAIAKDSLKLAESEKAQAEAQRRELSWRRSRTDVYAPVDGLILSRASKVGAIATAIGEPMFRIVKSGEIELDGEVTSDQLPKLKPGQTATIEINGLDSVIGKVRLVSPRVATETRLGKVLVFIGRDDRLRVGSFATAIIETAHSSGLAIPSESVMRDAQGPFVQIVENGKVAVRRIVTGLVADGLAEVREGLTAEHRVVAKAGTFLGPGERITPVEKSNTTPPAGQQMKAG